MYVIYYYSKWLPILCTIGVYNSKMRYFIRIYFYSSNEDADNENDNENQYCYGRVIYIFVIFFRIISNEWIIKIKKNVSL